MKKGILFLFVAGLMVSCEPNQPATEVEDEKSSPEIVINNKGDVDFDQYFLDKTMRLDYFHHGNATQEKFSVDRVMSDGPWPGSQTILIDPLQLGLYYYEIIDKASGTLLYSRGFASIFGEWQTIPEAKERLGTFSESIRFPWPKNEVTVVMNKRDTENNFQAIWSTDIDPSKRAVNPADIAHAHTIDIIMENGPAAEKVDIVILGDGYSKTEMEKFKSDAERLSEVLLNAEPFKTRKNDINIRAVETPAEESGVAKPHPGVFKRTPLSAHYSSFDSERYILTYDNRTVRDVASCVPYDFMVILINEKTYGGSGIYN